MKIIKYQIVQNTIQHGTEENPDIEVVLSPKERYSNDANLGENLAIVQAEAYNGEYTIEDDEQPESVKEPTPEQRIAELEEALELLLSGVTE